MKLNFFCRVSLRNAAAPAILAILLPAGAFAVNPAPAAEKPAKGTAEAKETKTEVKTETKAETKSGKGSKATKSAAKADAKSAVVLPKEIRKLVVEDSQVGSGKVATKGKTIKVNYTGWLYDPSQPMGRGHQFDSSVGKDPFKFKLGGGEVIKGWDEGFTDMKVGGKRKLIIPSDLGYGPNGAGSMIPPNAPLMFEVELLDVM